MILRRNSRFNGQTFRWSGKMILVVDDHEDTRYILTKLLTLDGHQVTAVDCGTAALAYLRGSEAPQLIILDNRMPDMDGLTVLAEIRKEQRFDNITVVMFSAD